MPPDLHSPSPALWRFSDSPDDAGTAFSRLDFEDEHWAVGAVLSGSLGEVRRFRRRLSTAAIAGKRSWLALRNMCTEANVWFDGVYLGDVDGCVIDHFFEVTDAVARRDDHVLALQMPKGTELHADATLDSAVDIVETGPVRISRLKALCTEASAQFAAVEVWAELDAAEASEVIVETRIDSADGISAHHELRRSVAAGRNRLHWSMGVNNPDLWWPWELGEQKLSNLTVVVREARRAHDVSDSRFMDIGLRHVGAQRNVISVNGERIFMRARPAEETTIADARSTGTNTIVSTDTHTSPEVLAAADRAGVLVLQSIPKDAKHIRQSVEALGSHPSLIGWAEDKGLPPWMPHKPSARLRTLQRADPSRPVVDGLRRVNSPAHADNARRRKYSPLAGVVLEGPQTRPVTATFDPVRILVALRRMGRWRHRFYCVDLHLVNDRRVDTSDGVMNASVSFGGEPVEWSWQGGATADSVAYVATIDLEVPEGAKLMDLTVTFESEHVQVRRRVTQRIDTSGMIRE